jgi:hypothetical protein
MPQKSPPIVFGGLFHLLLVGNSATISDDNNRGHDFFSLIATEDKRNPTTRLRAAGLNYRMNAKAAAASLRLRDCCRAFF